MSQALHNERKVLKSIAHAVSVDAGISANRRAAIMLHEETPSEDTSQSWRI
jgi:hypothetical protein